MLGTLLESPCDVFTLEALHELCGGADHAEGAGRLKAGVNLERDGESLVIRIPMQIKKRMGRKEIIVSEGLANSKPLKAAPQEPLITALARAFH